MMIVPRYWAEATARKRDRDGQRTVRRFGWSNINQADAQRMADERAAEALKAALAKPHIPYREPKVPYNGAEGVPIREEIIHEHGETIITRNSYGALCLNTPNVYFADVDYGRQPWRENRIITMVLAAIFIFLVCQFLIMLNWWMSAVIALVLSPILTFSFDASYSSFFNFTDAKKGEDEICLQRVRQFMESHPDWRLHVYKTPLGLRLLATHALFHPTSDEVAESFKALGVDKLYAQMCRRQHCFRARVSPKPWRIGIEGHLKPRPGVWPVNPERLPERQEWVRKYEELAGNFASCEYVETLGNGLSHPGAERVRQLHDEYCRATSGRPIA